MTAFNSYNTMMGTATVEADLARLVLPPALMVGMQFKLCKGNPTNLEKASKAWGDAARAIEDTAEQMQASVASISADDWTAEDRQAYERKVQEFLQQLQVMHTFCQAVQIALIAYAWALMVYATFAVVMGTFLAALAAAATAAAMGVITAGIAATCEAIAATCLSVTIVATSALGMAAQMAAVVFQGGALTAALAEKAKGNDAALADFMKAEEVGAAAAGANLAQNAVNGGLTFAGTPGMRRGGGFPVSDVDLDADRNGNRTWNVGGGATVNAGGFTTTGGGHVKYGDHGFAGGDVSGNVKHNASGFSAGGNAEYTDEDGIGRGNAGNVKYGANLAYQTPARSRSTIRRCHRARRRAAPTTASASRTRARSSGSRASTTSRTARAAARRTAAARSTAATSTRTRTPRTTTAPAPPVTRARSRPPAARTRTGPSATRPRRGTADRASRAGAPRAERWCWVYLLSGARTIGGMPGASLPSSP
ncbi:hypothetical protein ACFQHO_26220 [Actinomadura yumaensis]|uniref:hypothetical protein n=1 Tax=Actinomadura yumaensis TaxID=111807 RepID=UPI003609CFA2